MIQLWEWKQWEASFTTVNVLSHIYLYFRIKSAISKGEDEIQGCKCNCLLKLLRILFLYWMTFYQSVWNLKKVVNRVVTKQSNLVRVAETCVSIPFTHCFTCSRTWGLVLMTWVVIGFGGLIDCWNVIH